MKTFYFVSEKPVKLLTPRIPHNFLTENGYEDDVTKRICVSTSIDKCLIALSYSLQNKEFYVYKINEDKYTKPTVKQVPDVHLTDEHWIEHNIRPELYCKIKVDNAKEYYINSNGDKIPADKLLYSYGKYTAELCEWNYNIIKYY